MSESDIRRKQQIAEALREVRNRLRSKSALRQELPAYPKPKPTVERLGSMPKEPAAQPGASPDRSLLNERWDVSTSLESPPRGRLGHLLAPLRRPLQRLIRFALGPLIERQALWNSAQVRFDNELVAYLDERIDRISNHYDRIIGLHGKRMEEIDERHLILQQELIQHVHDLIQRIDFVFETAEQNHLYLEGSLRELREELEGLAEGLKSLTPGGASGEDGA